METIKELLILNLNSANRILSATNKIRLNIRRVLKSRRKVERE